MTLKVRTFLLMAFALAAMAPLAVFWLWPSSSLLESKYAEVQERHLLIANNLGAALETYHRDVVAAVDSFAPFIADGVGDVARPIFANLHFRHICVVDPETAQVTRTFMDENFSCPDQVAAYLMPLLKTLAAENTVGVSQVFAPQGQEPRLVLVRRVDDLLVCASIHTDFFRDLQERISFGRRGHAAIVDHTGRMLAHPSEEWEDTAYDMSALAPVRRMKMGETGVDTFYSPAMDAEMIAGFTAVAGAGWGVMVPQPISELEDAAAQFNREVMIILCAGLALSLLLAMLISGLFSRRLLSIEGQLKQVGDGSYLASDPGQNGPFGIRELRSLQRGVSKMADATTKARAETNARNRQLVETNAQLRCEIQNRETAEEQRDGSHARFRNLFDSAPIPIREEDLSRLKQAVDVLGISQPAALNQYLNDNPDFITRCGQLITIVDANQAAVDLHGFENKEQMLSQVLRELGPQSRDVVRKTIMAVHAGDRQLSYEISIKTARGDSRQIAGSWMVISGHEDTYRRILLTSIDLTDHKESEERIRKAQKMEAIGQLTGGIAHDFNNLLTVIHGNVDLIDEDINHARNYVDPIRRAVDRGSELTQRLLSFSRQQPLAPKTIDLVELITDMTQMLRRTLGENVSIDFEYENGLWPALADPNQLANALLNMGLNARDAMSGGGTLTIACSNTYVMGRQADELEDGHYVMIAVSDTGPGMPDDVASRAFEPFFTTKAVGKGSGLGLSMVYGFAKQSLGHAAIEITPGNGATICILLPRGMAEPESYVQSRQSGGLVRGNGQPILVLEDQEDVQTYMSDLLQLLGYRPLLATTASQATELLLNHEDIRVALCDIMLPGGTSGTDFASAALQDYPDLNVIFISGNPPSTRLEEDERLRSCTLLTKPFDSKRLSELIKSSMG